MVILPQYHLPPTLLNSTPTASHLHLSNSERKQRKAREEGKRDWYMAGQTFCVLITHRWPDFHLLDSRPLPLGVQEENAAFGVIELRCWVWEQ